MDRRNFLRLMAATGTGMAAGCNSQTAEKLLPYLEQPEEMTPGTAVYYATTCLECSHGCGVLARTREGRVVKLEGNPQHPLSQGALCARGQAALQGLYNPDRISKPLARNEDGELVEVSWDVAYERLKYFVLEGTHSWLTGAISDSDSDLVDICCRASGVRKPVNLNLYTEMPLYQASQQIFGTSGMPEFHFGNADLIVSLNADFLETWGNPVAQTLGFTKMHSYRGGAGGKAIYIGSRQGNTAACCDKWIKMKPGLESASLRIIAEHVIERIDDIDSIEYTKIEYLLNEVSLEVAKLAVGDHYDELVEIAISIAKANAPLIVASGLGKDAELAHSLALLITHLAGGTGKTLSLPEPGRQPHGNSLGDTRGLVNDFAAGIVTTLLVHSANPAFIIPGADELLERGDNLVYFGTQMDETASKADLVIPIHHSLESWGDHAAASGVTGLLQPVMKPIFGTRQFADIIIEMNAKVGTSLPWKDGNAYFEERLQALSENEPNSFSVRDLKKRGGWWQETELVSAEISNSAEISKLPAILSGHLAQFFPHPYLFDGRGADKSWLQEVPESSTSIVWGSWVEIHPETAREINAKKGDAIELTANNATVTAPVLITEQVIPGTFAMPIGQGHTVMGRYAEGRGANPVFLSSPTDGGTATTLSGIPVEIKVVKGKGKDLVAMAGSQDQGERDIARAITIPKDDAHDEHGDQHHIDLTSTFYPDKEYELYDWGMTIDLDTCTGCGACSVACYAENNLGIVEEKYMREGREMSWIRIEKYADEDDVRMIPNLCQHCHHAPCEPVCPVQAAYHNDEGLNAQVYNRCVGTRYCSNNCPYKVRRFNWFDYEYPSPLHLQLNPDVSVRERGVMEKCTFCIQRIKIAKEDAKNEGRIVADGEVVPACAQTCPAQAITFGNLLDENSAVTKQFNDKRAYRLLEELGTRPSVTYLKKVIRKDL